MLTLAGPFIWGVTRSGVGERQIVFEVAAERSGPQAARFSENPPIRCFAGWLRDPQTWPGGLDSVLMTGYPYHCIAHIDLGDDEQEIEKASNDASNAVLPTHGAYSVISSVRDTAFGHDDLLWLLPGFLNALIVVVISFLSGLRLSEELSSLRRVVSTKGYGHSIFLLSPFIVQWSFSLLRSSPLRDAGHDLWSLIQGFGASAHAAVIQHCIIAPVVEEFTYRYLMLRLLLMAFGAKGAVFISATFFAAAHGGSYLQFFLGGIALGAIWIRYRSIALCILIHAGLNLGPALASFSA